VVLLPYRCKCCDLRFYRFRWLPEGPADHNERNGSLPEKAPRASLKSHASEPVSGRIEEERSSWNGPKGLLFRQRPGLE
jgi:hypothetical protein